MHKLATSASQLANFILLLANSCTAAAAPSYASCS